MKFEDWWKKQTENFDPEEIGPMQLARVAWNASRDLENEACARLCENASTDGYGYLPYAADCIRRRTERLT